MQRKIIFLILLLISKLTIGQTFTIYGTVRDSLSNETIIGANIYTSDQKHGVSSNQYGFYSLSLPEGTHQIRCSFIGYQTIEFEIDLHENFRYDFAIVENRQTIAEVSVSGERSNNITGEIGHNNMKIESVKYIPTVCGESDIMKALQLLPGVQSVNEGVTNLYVRGGSFDENLILLDEAPVYNPAHSLGFFSIFNTDALKNIDIYKGYFPAQYGGRLSSVVDINMREGNLRKAKGELSVGAMASKLTIEAPIRKDKSSFLLSGRYGYAGAALNLFANKVAYNIFGNEKAHQLGENNDIEFYDLNAKINYIVNARNRIYLSGYSGHDYFKCMSVVNDNILSWGNTTTSLRWNHIFSDKLFSNYTIYYSKYKYKYYITDDLRQYDWRAHIEELGAKADFVWYANNRNTVRFGAVAMNHAFAPGEITQHDTTSLITNYALDDRHAIEYALYLSNQQKLLRSITVDYGVRMTSFVNLGETTIYEYDRTRTIVKDSSCYSKGEIVNTYYGIEPRLGVNYLLNDRNSIKISYAHNTQYLHLLSNSSVGMPTDVWLPPDKHIRPQQSDIVSLGYSRTLFDTKLEFSSEIYYKRLHNIIDYKDNANLFLNKHIETQTYQGKGYSQGIEFMLERKQSRLTGWLSYTLAKTQYKIDEINRGEYYSPRYDIRHNLSTTANYQLTESISLSGTFKLSSGGYISFPDGIAYIYRMKVLTYSERNNYKMPMNHRLDIAINYNNPRNEYRRIKTTWNFSIYNIYNQHNAYAIIAQDDSDCHFSVKKLYLYNIIPSITCNIKF